AVLGKAGKDGKSGGAIKPVIGINIRHMRIDFGVGRHLQITVDTEYLPHGHLHVGQAGGLLNSGHRGGRHQSSEVSGIPETRSTVWLRMGTRQIYQRARVGRSPRPDQSSVGYS